MEYVVDNYEHPDSDIVYSVSNIPGLGVDLSCLESQLCTKCNCSDDGACSQEESCACLQISGKNYCVDKLVSGKFTISSSVIECGSCCSCSTGCGNRLVQFGPRLGLKMSVATNGKGYGLSTDETITCGNFICEYAGELIGKQEAINRAKRQRHLSNYIFVMREHCSGHTIETIVDPTRIGNIGRYINHSCDPNAAVVPVRVDSPIPHLGIFATKNILAGEEITYNYAGVCDGKTGNIPCLCGEINCRGFLPYDDELLNYTCINVEGSHETNLL